MGVISPTVSNGTREESNDHAEHQCRRPGNDRGPGQFPERPGPVQHRLQQHDRAAEHARRQLDRGDRVRLRPGAEPVAGGLQHRVPAAVEDHGNPVPQPRRLLQHQRAVAADGAVVRRRHVRRSGPGFLGPRVSDAAFPQEAIVATFTVNMSNVQEGASEMSATARYIQGLLEALDNGSKQNLAEWTSSARDAYNQAKAIWDNAAADMGTQASNA